MAVSQCKGELVQGWIKNTPVTSGMKTIACLKHWGWVEGGKKIPPENLKPQVCPMRIYNVKSHNQSNARLIVSLRCLGEPDAHPLEEFVSPKLQAILYVKILRNFSSYSNKVTWILKRNSRQQNQTHEECRKWNCQSLNINEAFQYV